MENVTVATALQIALTLVAFLGGWMIKSLSARIDKLEQAEQKIMDNISALREELPKSYVRHDRMDNTLNTIYQMLRDISDKLDMKADKE